MTDYYDGPRKGIADFEGTPHFYDSEWDDLDESRDLTGDYTSTYRLSPIESRLLELALESWRIWLRWKTAFDEGRTSLEPYGALPEERLRRDELNEILNRELKIDEQNYARARGVFEGSSEDDRKGVGMSLQVKWTRS